MLFALLLLCWLLIQTETVQNFIVRKVTARLSTALNTEVKINHVSLTLFNKMNLEGMLIRDHQKDTFLYAGKVKVRVTDWFFFKDKIDLKYVGLEDAVVKQYRKDSVWNYQFLVDYFQSPPDPNKKKKKGIVLNLKKVDLKNIGYYKHDEWVGEDMTVKAASVLVDADNIDFAKNIFQVEQVTLDKPVFMIRDYEGKRPPKPKQKKPVKDTSMYFNSSDMLVQVGTIKITNGTFQIGKLKTNSDAGVFDGSNIETNKVQATITGFNFTKDTIRANLELAAKERSGFEVKKLKAQFRLTPHIMEFAKLDVHTNKSHLKNYYAMKYGDFNKDMSDYIDKIVMDAHIAGSEIFSDDVAFFAPELKTWKKQVSLSGKYLGTVADFSVKELFVKNIDGSFITGDLTMKGLTDIDKTYITLTNGNLQTTYNNAADIIPALKGINQPNLAALGTLRYKGTFSGTINDFTTNGTMSTDLGGMYTNISMKLPKRGEPIYTGSLITQQFNLGKFISVPSIGIVSFKGKIDGSGFELEKVNTSLDGSFEQFEFNDYKYANLIFNGSIRKKNFQGEFKANDPNFSFTSNIQIDLNDSIPKFNILGDLSKSDLQALKLTHDKFELSGLFDLDFAGKNIDQFLGSAKLLNATLKHDSTRLSFDSLTLSASIDTANRKVLYVQSNELDVRIRGQYDIMDLPNSFQLFLNKYFPSYIQAPAEAPKNQRFSVNIKTRDVSRYLQILDTKLGGLDSATIIGGVNTKDSGTFFLRTDIPYMRYDKYKLVNAKIQGRGDSIKLNLTGDVEKVYIGDSLFFPNTKLNIVSSGDHSNVHLSTSANTTLNDAQLNADVFTLEDGIRIDLQPSSFVVNDKKWNLDKQGELVIRRNYAMAKNVRFSQGFQEITVETEEVDGSNRNDLVVRLKNVNIGDFTPLFTKKPRMEGIANGNVYMSDFFGKFNIDAQLRAEQFRLNDDSVGVVTIGSQFNSSTGMVKFDVKSENDKYNLVSKGSFNTKDSIGQPLMIETDLRNAKVSILNELLDNLFTDIKGQASGKLIVKGNPSAPDLLGRVTLRDGGIKVKYTQVYYSIDSAVFDFKDGLIDFGEFKIHDNRNNTGTIKGKLYEKGFKNMRYDFDLSTNKLLLLDTKAKDNQQFYGRAIGQATLSLKGPQDNMRMTITGAVNDTTHIYIPTSVSRETADADFITFKKYGKDIKVEAKESETKLNIDLDLTANNQAQIDVILDELTGDVISAQGDGRLQINVPATGSMTMKGRYNIGQGKYNFNFQSLIKKPFYLQEDAGNFIEWNGDPYNANIHIDAQYIAERISLNDLLGNQPLELSSSSGVLRGYRGDVYVIAMLRGKLSRPDIKFRIDFPPNSAVKNDNDLVLLLNRMQNDDNEMLKQVTYLVVFGSFAPYGDSKSAVNNAASIGVGVINTISQKITSELNKLLSNVLYKLTGDKSLQLDVNTSTYSSASLFGAQDGANKLDRQNVNLKLSQSLADGKVIIKFGGDLDFNLSNSQAVQNGSFQWLPDISVEFVLTRNRKLRAIIFNKSSLDVTSGNTSGIGKRNRQGASISYTKDFEKLFGNKPKEQKQPTPEKPKTTSD
ncbi:MAG: translocation/assembly module TamB domain-containing protein [Filimonas sp.]|nr:translocation/assembly module TamB domain-containing protein [Filimonas sp.]